jgi:hypothetical protein
MTIVSDLIESHFWLLCGLWVGGFGSLMFYTHLSRHVKAGRLGADERSRFVRGWLCVIAGTSLVFWLLQFSMGPGSLPYFVSWPSPQRWLAVLFLVMLWLGLLWWIFLKGGAEYLARIASLGHSPFRFLFARPVTFRVLAILSVASGVFALTLREWQS